LNLDHYQIKQFDCFDINVNVPDESKTEQVYIDEFEVRCKTLVCSYFFLNNDYYLIIVIFSRVINPSFTSSLISGRIFCIFSSSSTTSIKIGRS